MDMRFVRVNIQGLSGAWGFWGFERDRFEDFREQFAKGDPSEEGALRLHESLRREFRSHFSSNADLVREYDRYWENLLEFGPHDPLPSPLPFPSGSQLPEFHEIVEMHEERVKKLLEPYRRK